MQPAIDPFTERILETLVQPRRETIERYRNARNFAHQTASK